MMTCHTAILIPMRWLLLTSALFLVGCNAIAVTPTAPRIVTPAVEPPPLELPDTQAVRLSLSTSQPEIFAGEGLSLRAIALRGEIPGPAVYAWTFGDGASETTTIGSAGHTYDRAGDYPATVTVRDRDGKTAEANTLVQVVNRPRAPRPPPEPPPPPECPNLIVSPSTLPNGTVGTNYSRTITASAGQAPYTFAVASGTLPAGLLLATGGGLSGSPTTAETATFIVHASDNRGCMGARSYTITIAAAPPPPGVLTASMNCTAHATLNQVSCNISGTYGGQPVPSANVSNVDWDWGAGTPTSSTSPAQTHLYTQPGTWTVIGTMTATTSGGVKSATASKTVTVPAP